MTNLLERTLFAFSILEVLGLPNNAANSFNSGLKGEVNCFIIFFRKALTYKKLTF